MNRSFARPGRLPFYLAVMGLLAASVACGSNGSDAGPAPAGPSGQAPAPSPAPAAPAPSPSVPPPTAPSPDGSTQLLVFFKLDERVTGGAYMGDRWVSPPTFTLVQQSATVDVNARSYLVDSSGQREVVATWTASAPDVVAVSPTAGHEVQLTVLRSGTSAVTVTSPGKSTELTVVATLDAGVWRVDVTR